MRDYSIGFFICKEQISKFLNFFIAAFSGGTLTSGEKQSIISPLFSIRKKDFHVS